MNAFDKKNTLTNMTLTHNKNCMSTIQLYSILDDWYISDVKIEIFCLLVPINSNYSLYIDFENVQWTTTMKTYPYTNP